MFKFKKIIKFYRIICEENIENLTRDEILQKIFTELQPEKIKILFWVGKSKYFEKYKEIYS